MVFVCLFNDFVGEGDCEARREFPFAVFADDSSVLDVLRAEWALLHVFYFVERASPNVGALSAHASIPTMFDKDTWRFVNTFAPWFSALGTLLAVITSLWLARRSSRLALRVFPAIIKTVYQDEYRTQTSEFVKISVVNHGRTAVVTGFGWLRLMRIGKRKHWVILPPGGTHTTSFPKKLEFGEEASILLPTATFNKDAEWFLQAIRSAWFPRLEVRLLRVVVFASTGQQFRVALDKHLRKFLLARASQSSES